VGRRCSLAIEIQMSLASGSEHDVRTVRGPDGREIVGGIVTEPRSQSARCVTMKTSLVLSVALARLDRRPRTVRDRLRSLNCNRSSTTAVWFPARSDKQCAPFPCSRAPVDERAGL
jgi:hypothetical protein